MKRSDVNEGHHFMDSDSVLIIKAKVCKAPGFACAACLQQQCQQPHHGPVSIHSLPSLTMISDYKLKKKIFFFFSFLPSNFPPPSLLSFLPTVTYAALKSHLPVLATLWFLSITSRNNANWMGDQSFSGAALDFLNKSGGKISRKKLQLLWVCKGKRRG